MYPLKKKLIVAFLASGISASAAFVAYYLTLPSEGLEQKVYLDPVGLPTVCVGHMERSLKIGTSFSIEQCMEIFAKDWKKHEQQLESVVSVPFKSEWQKAALTDFTFNLGIGSVKSSTLIKKLNQGKHVEACKELSKWVYAKGKKLKGLVTRRENTLPYCLGELPYDKQKQYEQFLKEWKEIEMAQKLETAS